MAVEGPEASQTIPVAVADPETQAIPRHRTTDGPPEDGPELEPAGGDQGAEAEHGQHPRHQQAEHGHRLGEGDKEDRQPGPEGVGLDPVDQQGEEFTHA